MGTATSERPAWPSRLLAVTFYLGLAPLLAVFRLHRRNAYVQHHFTQAVTLVGLLAFLLLRSLVGGVVSAYLLLHHDDVSTTYLVLWIDNVVSAVLLVPWALVWLLAVAVALRRSVWRLPLLGRLSGKRRIFRVALVGNVGLTLVPVAVCALTLHARAITREADDRPAAVYLLYHEDAPVPRCVFALGFYRMALEAQARWGPDSVVVDVLTEKTLHQAMRHGRLVVLGTHGIEGNVTTPLVLVQPVKGRSGCYLRSIVRASTDEPFLNENARRIEIGGNLQFVFASACEGRKKEDVWRAALTPAEVRLFKRASLVHSHVLWLWWDGPGEIRKIDPGPRPAPTEYRRGVALFEQEKWAEAEAAFRRAAKLDPAFARAYFHLGLAQQQQKKWAEAEKAYRAATKLAPNYSLAHDNLGWVQQQQKKWAEAERAYRTVTNLKPEDAVAQNNLGRALYEQQKWAEAETAFRTATKLDPKYAVAHFNLGAALRKQQKWAEAEKAYRTATKLDPKNATAYHQLGWALFKQEKWADMEGAYRRVTVLAPRDAIAHRHLGVALLKQKRWAEAEKVCRTAIELEPNHAEANRYLGWALHEQQKWAEAENAYRTATKLDPKNALAYSGLGWALQKQQKSAEAEQAYRTVTTLEPQNASAQNDLGLALYEQQKWAEAETAFRTATKIDPNYAVAHRNLGAALRRQGQWAEAERAYRRAIDAGDRSPATAARLPVLRLQAKLHPALPAYLAGLLQPSGNDDRLALAAVCRFERLHASAVRFSAAAFAADPKRADDLDAYYRYSAACSAVRAAAGEGCDAPRAEAGKARLRGQALAWLQADLALWGKRLATGKEDDRTKVRNEMRFRQQDADLADVRGEKPRAALPEAERREWTRLWADVAALLKQADGK
jgi:tetratricopeptide (TPR) repeat protein